MAEWGKLRIRIEGVMPERALLRLRRAGVSLFGIKKKSKTELDCTVPKKEIEKVFAIYPKICYNVDGKSTYAVRVLGETGLAKPIAWAKHRLGFLLGALCFCIASLYVNTLVLGVEFVGSRVYAREAVAVLEEYGVRTFVPYKSGNEDLVCSKLLALRGVEFCSVKKFGLYLRVEMHLNDEMPVPIRAGAYKAQHTGVITELTVLRGTPVKNVGDSVVNGEVLIADYFTTVSGEKVRVDAVGRACIACVYESVIPVETEEEAFATAYLSAGIEESDVLTETRVTPTKNGFAVRLAYRAVESFNL